MAPQKDYFTLKELAQLTGKTKNTIRNHIKNKLLTGKLFDGTNGQEYRFDKKENTEYLKKHTIQSLSPSTDYSTLEGSTMPTEILKEEREEYKKLYEQKDNELREANKYIQERAVYLSNIEESNRKLLTEGSTKEKKLKKRIEIDKWLILLLFISVIVLALVLKGILMIKI